MPLDIIQAMTKVQQYSFVCAPSVTQYAALACPQVDLSANIAAYRRKPAKTSWNKWLRSTASV